MSEASQVAKTKYHSLCGSLNKPLFHTVLEDGRSKVPVDFVLGEGLLPGMQMAGGLFSISSHDGEGTLVSHLLLIRTLISFGRP